MQQLNEADMHAALGVIASVYASGNLDEFAAAACTGIKQLIACDIAAYDEINTAGQQVRAIIYPCITNFPEMLKSYVSVLDDHPLVAHNIAHPDAGAVKISDLMNTKKFRASRTYADFYGQMRIESVIGFQLHTAGQWRMVLGLLRGCGRDFGECDRRLLNVLRPHLAQAYNIATAMGERKREIAMLHCGLDSLDQGLVLADADYRVRVISARARQLMTKYFAPLKPGVLPKPLDAWFREQTAMADELPGVRLPFIAEGASRRLVVRLSGVENYLLILEEEITALQPADLAPLGLTQRETEILAWMTLGKTNAVIAQILSLSPRTVHHTVERIYRKLGVETRAAAVARACQALRYGCAG